MSLPTGFYVTGKKNSEISFVRRHLRGYFDPGLLDTVTYHSAAEVTWTGTATTSKHFHTPTSTAFNFNTTNKFTLSFWFQPSSAGMVNGDIYLISRSDPSTSGWYAVYTTNGANKHHFDFYIAGVWACRIDASVLPAVGGHVMICYDGAFDGGGANSDRARVYINGVKHCRSLGNMTFLFSTLPPAALLTYSYPITLGANGGRYQTVGRCNGVFRDVAIWNQDHEAYASTLWNGGEPLGYAAMPSALKASSLIDFWEMSGTNTGAESSVTYTSATGSGRNMACRFQAASGSTPGAATATANRAFATRIRNPYASGDSFFGAFGSAPEYLHPSLWTGGSSDLFSKAALRSWGLNHWNVSAAQTMRFEGDYDRIGNNDSGDMLMVNYIRDRGTAENFYMSFQNNGTPFGATKYFICGYFDSANSFRPTYRIANPPVFNSNVTYSDASLNVATGDKHLVHYFRDPGGALRYQRTVLATGVMTEGTHPGGSVPDCWTNYGGAVTHIFLGGHERSMSLRGDIGRFAVATGLGAIKRAAMRKLMLKGYA